VRFLLDTSATKSEPGQHVAGQLLTPLSNYRLGPHPFAIDNGGFSGFDAAGFRRLLAKCLDARERCLFVAVPDVVGSARRTLEMFRVWTEEKGVLSDWPLALVAQDGIEDLEIPWHLLAAVFIGGTTRWKESQSAADVVRSGIITERHVHIGRVNTVRRFRKFEALGADTCDGSGVVRFGWMMERIVNGHYDDQPGLDFGDAVGAGEAGVSEVGTGDTLAAT
jgi:hypothetical protein